MGFKAGTSAQLPGWLPMSQDGSIGTTSLLPGFAVKLLEDPYTAMFYGGVLLVSTDTTRRFIARFGVDSVKPSDWDYLRVHDAFDMLPTENRSYFQTKNSNAGTMTRGLAFQARGAVEPRMFKATPGSNKEFVVYGIVSGAYAGIIWNNAFGSETNGQTIRVWYGDVAVPTFPTISGSPISKGPNTQGWEPTDYTGSTKSGGSGTTPSKYGIPQVGGVIWGVLRCPLKSRFAGSIDAALAAYQVPNDVLADAKAAYSQVVSQLPTHAPLLHGVWYGGNVTTYGFGLLEVPAGDKIRPALKYQRYLTTLPAVDTNSVAEERSILQAMPMVFDDRGTAMLVNGMGDSGVNDGYACRLEVVNPKPTLEEALPVSFKDGDVVIPAAQVYGRVSMLITKATGPQVKVSDLIATKLYADVLEAGNTITAGQAGLDTTSIGGAFNAMQELKKWQKVTEVKDDNYRHLDGFSRHVRWAIYQIDKVVKDYIGK